jgi:hypothetical protein
LKKKYGLSIQAMAFRFRDLGIISDSYFSVFFAYMNQRDFKVNEPGSKELTFQEEPMAYRAQIYRAVSEGLLSEKDAARFIPGFHVGPQTASLGTLSEIRKLLSIPKEEREKVLDAAAAAALDDYRNPDLNISEVVDDIKEYP